MIMQICTRLSDEIAFSGSAKQHVTLREPVSCQHYGYWAALARYDAVLAWNSRFAGISVQTVASETYARLESR